MISDVCSSSTSVPTTSTSASWARIFIDNFISPSSLYRLAIISCEPPPPPPPALEPVQLPARTNLGRLLSPPSSAFRLFAFAPAARRLWRGIRRALLVYTTTSPEPVISDAFAADTDDASSDPVCGSVFDALDTTLIGPEERHKLPVRPSDHADYGLWHARLGHFGRNKIIGPLRYRGYVFRPGSDRCECAACRLNRRRKGHPSQPTNRRVYTHFGERVASDLCGPFKLLPFSIHKFKFAINFVDYFSGVIAVYFLENGSSPEIVSAVRAFLRDYAHLLTDTRNPGVMDEWLTDNASYFTSELTDELCITLSIQRFFSSPDIHEGNALAERCWGTLLHCTRTALVHAGGDREHIQFWPYLFSQFARVHNLLQTNRGSNAEPRWVSPIEVASGHPRNYALENFKVMLCDCSCVLPESLRAHDLTPTRLKGINLGHDPRRSKYLVYIPAVRRIISTADVIFDEFSFTTLGGAWQPFKIRGAVEQERPQVPEAIVRAEPPAAPAAPRGAPIAPPAARAAPAQPAVPRRSPRIAARG